MDVDLNDKGNNVFMTINLSIQQKKVRLIVKIVYVQSFPAHRGIESSTYHCS